MNAHSESSGTHHGCCSFVENKCVAAIRSGSSSGGAWSSTEHTSRVHLNARGRSRKYHSIPHECQQEERLSHSLPPHRQPLPFVGAAPESGKALVGHGEGEAFVADRTGPADVTLPFWVFAARLTHPVVRAEAAASCTELPVGAIEKSRLHYTSQLGGLRKWAGPAGESRPRPRPAALTPPKAHPRPEADPARYAFSGTALFVPGLPPTQ